MKKLIIFDYDNTLAKPVSVPPDKILTEISRLLKENYIAIMSGGRTLEQMENLFVRNIPIANKESLENLFICPSYGNKMYRWSCEGPSLIYETEEMLQEERAIILAALRELEEVEDGISKEKDGYIAFACLGKDVSNEEKRRWDPNGSKRLPIKKKLDEILNDKFDLFIAGRTTIDIVVKGKNKADNTVRLAKMLDVPLTNVVYTGDEFQVYGNDYPLLSLQDVQINIIKNPTETLKVLKQI